MPVLSELKRNLPIHLEPEEISIAGLLLTIAGACAGNEPRICIPAITVGLSLMAYGTHKMEERNQEFPPH